MMTESFPAGALILEDGQSGTEAYIVRSGRVEIFREVAGERVILGHVGPGAIFGEMALIDDGPRMASARALEATECMVVTRPAFITAFNKAPPLVRFMLQTQVNTIRAQVGASFSTVAPLGRSTRIVSDTSTLELLTRQVFSQGRVIMNEGDPGKVAYLIQSGLVEFTRLGPADETVVLRHMGPGCVFGEMALVSKRLRSATATALEPTVCEVINEERFAKLVKQAPPVIGLLLKAYIHHVEQLRNFPADLPVPSEVPRSEAGVG